MTDIEDKIPSADLALLILDRLVYAKCVEEGDFGKGVIVATGAIDARKALGDYDLFESIDLAMIIVNELIKARLTQQVDFNKAVKCTDEEIIARQAAGDY
jgi:hypothetical protein